MESARLTPIGTARIPSLQNKLYKSKAQDTELSWKELPVWSFSVELHTNMERGVGYHGDERVQHKDHARREAPIRK